MAHLIVKQPNGKYSCWSTITDSFIQEDLTKEEYIEYQANRAAMQAREELHNIFSNEKLLKRASKDYQSCLDIMARVEQDDSE